MTDIKSKGGNEMRSNPKMNVKLYWSLGRRKHKLIIFVSSKLVCINFPKKLEYVEGTIYIWVGEEERGKSLDRL